MRGRSWITAGTVATCLACAVPAAAAPNSSTVCPAGQIKTVDGCATFAEARRGIESVVQQTVDDNDLRAALVGIDVGPRPLARIAVGDSMAGVPAKINMHFRIGSIAIPFLIDVLLQLDEEGRLSL